LPGDVYRKLPVTGGLALLSLTIALAYLVPMILHRKILLHIQYGFFIVITVGVIEVSAWYFYRKERNDTGLIDKTSRSLILVVFLANFKRTLTRVLLLLMAMGVGVVKWTLGNARIKIAILAVAFLSFSFIRELIQEMQSLEKNKIVGPMTLFSIVVPAALLDTCFYYWIILSLIRTIQQLTLRKQALKLDMYKWFFGVLAVAGVISLCFALYMFAVQFNAKLAPWQNEWIQDMFWEILFFAVMGAIAILWRPRANNTRYGYAEFFPNAETKGASPTGDNVGEEVIQLETLEIVSGGELNQRRKGDHPEPERKSANVSKTLSEVTETLPEVEQSFLNVNEYFDLPDADSDEEISLDTQLKKLD